MNMFEGLGEVFKSIREERKRPKTMKEVLEWLIERIEAFNGDNLYDLFIESGKYKKIFVDWDYQKLKEPEELLEEIYKESIPYTMKDEHDYCPQEGCNKPFAEDFDWDSYQEGKIERPKECHECFLDWKNEWCEKYKIAMKMGIIYIKSFLIENSQKLRKEYKTSFNHKKISDFFT